VHQHQPLLAATAAAMERIDVTCTTQEAVLLLVVPDSQSD
jgi:hypothetical protein